MFFYFMPEYGYCPPVRRQEKVILITDDQTEWVISVQLYTIWAMQCARTFERLMDLIQ